MAELNTIIDEGLFLNSTSTLTGDYFIKVVGGNVEYLPASDLPTGDTATTDTKAYSGIILTTPQNIALPSTNIALSSEYVDVFNNIATVSTANLNVDTATNPGKFTITESGAYQVNFWMSFDSDDAGDSVFAVAISNDGTTTGITPYKAYRSTTSAGTIGSVSASGIFELQEGDVLGLFFAQESAQNNSVTVTIEGMGFSVSKVS